MDDDVVKRWERRQAQWDAHWRWGRPAPTLFDSPEEKAFWVKTAGAVAVMFLAVCLIVVMA